MPKKLVPIRYTNRDFSSIRESLLEHARRYYPNTFKDFNEASFGSLMIDTVSYIGDVLSFYLDYQANESFLQTAAEYQNVLKLSRTLGFKFNKSPSSYGVCQFFALVPVVPSTGAPDMRYAPLLKAGSRVATVSDVSFTLIEDVSFENTDSDIVVAKVDEDTGAPLYYAIKSEGRVVSGELLEHTQAIGDFKRFLTVSVPGTNVSDIVSVTDAEGHEYFEVEHLSQNTVFKPVANSNAANDTVANLLKAVSVPRRYTVEHLDDQTNIQFGYGSETEMVSGSIADPSNVLLKRHAKDYISDTSFDPSKLTSTDKFGIAPANTTLSVVYRSNTSENVNAAANQIIRVLDADVEFNNVTALDSGVRDYIVNSIEVSNDEPIVGDVSLPSVEELKTRAMGNFATQNRAVTKQDYVSATYAMPGKFGAIKRCTIFKDEDSFKRNLNLYILSENLDGELVKSGKTLKLNLKTWLDNVRMMNDTIDILDAHIVNIGINFSIVVDDNANKYEVLRKSSKAIEDTFLIHKDIGEPLVISDYFKVLKDIEEIVDVVSVEIVNKVNGPYSGLDFDVSRNSSADGRVVTPGKIQVFELKYPDVDIRGTIV
tara:strand:+ start:679 stop:2472 length:1794 start_codon:yes stop_codon:yes gene_type:complete